MPESLSSVQRRKLLDGLRELDLVLSTQQIDQLLEYLQLLARWNQAFNLTAVRDPLDHVSRHILDSLSIRPYLQGRVFADVGTGAGLPGLPLAISLPETTWFLVDSNGKRTRFLTQCLVALKLTNVTVFQSRIERWVPPKELDGIVSRAFSSLGGMIENCDRITRSSTTLYAMKASVSDDEMAEISPNFNLLARHSLQVPDCEANRELLIIRRGQHGITT